MAKIAEWAPPEWAYNCFPLPNPEAEVVTLEFVIAAMQAQVDVCTECDWAPLGRVLHVAHMLVCHQGGDGLWATALNARTGEDIGDERTSAPLPLFRRLNAFLNTSEFDAALQCGEAGVLSHKG